MPSMGEILAHLGLNDSKFKAGVHNVGQWSKTKFATIGASAASAFAGAFAIDKIGEVITLGSEFQVMALQAGITTEQFQRLNTVIERANGDASDTVSIMLDLKRAMADARTGNAQWVKDFESLGISMDMIKKDDPVALFMAIGRTVAKSAELTGEQVNALGRMMGEDTSARAIAAFRNNFEGTLKSVNVMADSTIQKLQQINAELKAAQAETNVEIANLTAANQEAIIKGTTGFEKLKRESVIGSVIAFNAFNENFLTPVNEGLSDFFTALMVKDFGFKEPTLVDASKEFKRREEIQSMFTKGAGDEAQTDSKLSIKILKDIEKNTRQFIGEGSIMGM